MNNKFAHLALLAVALIYGVNYSIAKEVMFAGLEPRGFILMRVLGAAVLFWMTHAFMGMKQIKREDFPRLFFSGLFGVAMNQILFFEGLDRTMPIVASIIMTTNPMLVLVLSAIFAKEKITWMKSLGIVLGTAGATWLILGKSTGQWGGTGLGNLLIFLNASSYGVYLVVVKPLMLKYPPIQVIKWVFTFGLMIVLPLGYRQLIEAPYQNWALVTYLQAGFVVLFTTYIAYLFNVFSMKYVTSTVVSSYIYLQPFFTSIVAILWGKDVLTLQSGLAAILVFSGIYLVAIRKS